MDKKIPTKKKGFNKLPEKIQEKISPKLAKEFNMGGMVDKRSPFMGGGIAYAGGGRAMKRSMYSEGTKPKIKQSKTGDAQIAESKYPKTKSAIKRITSSDAYKKSNFKGKTEMLGGKFFTRAEMEKKISKK